VFTQFTLTTLFEGRALSSVEYMFRKIKTFCTFIPMKQHFFKGLAKLNKLLLPNFTKQGLDLGKASKLQLALIGWKAYVTKRALD